MEILLLIIAYPFWKGAIQWCLCPWRRRHGWSCWGRASSKCAHEFDGHL